MRFIKTLFIAVLFLIPTTSYADVAPVGDLIDASGAALDPLAICDIDVCISDCKINSMYYGYGEMDNVSTWTDENQVTLDMVESVAYKYCDAARKECKTDSCKKDFLIHKKCIEVADEQGVVQEKCFETFDCYEFAKENRDEMCPVGCAILLTDNENICRQATDCSTTVLASPSSRWSLLFTLIGLVSALSVFFAVRLGHSSRHE